MPIIGTLPNTLTNGTTADATAVMSDLNFIVSEVNANAATLAGAALLAAANQFTALQSGIAATQPANFPIASQVQSWSFNTLTSTLGTNTITARVVGFALGAYAAGQAFSFIPTQPNTGAAAIRIDSLNSAAILWNNTALVGGELRQDVPALIRYDGTNFHMIGNSAFLNAYAVMDSTTVYRNLGDPTKEAQWNLASIAASTRRTFRFPNNDGTILLADAPSQTITGGANVSTFTLPVGSFTLNHGNRPLFSITNNAAFSILGSGVTDGSSVMLMTNSNTAGNVTLTGFRVGQNSGDSLTSTNGDRYMFTFMTIGGISTFSIKSLQST